MSEQAISANAEVLVQARKSGTSIDALPSVPGSVAEAHAIQDRVSRLLGTPIGAFKANAPPGQEPTRGPIYTPTVRRSPARFEWAEAPHLGVEGEVAFRFARDLPARSAPYSREEVAAAVVALPTIEVVSSRFRDTSSRPALEQLADGIANAGLVCGPETQAWSALDFTRLHVTLRVNGETVVDKDGGHSLGDPLQIAVALVELMRDRGGVRAGQIVTTGSWTGLRYLKPGDRCSVTFETLGTAEVVFGA
ncbi:MAG: fumarylacetoacetate hydrolase family protein [Proteobacteria bacterium]|nr:fumarylacetoacetate hydrolase family protein [Pseudomonadota bacterium]